MGSLRLKREKIVTKILTVSSANMDFVMDTPKVPVAGESLICDGGYKYVPGGKGANSAVAVARLGGESVFCTAVGCDANGDALVSLYESEKIDTRYIGRVADAPTGLAAIMVEPDGKNRIIIYPGANRKIADASVDKALTERPDALFMQLETSPETVVHAANKAFELGVPVVIDAGPADVAFPLESLPFIEIFSPNETETEIFTGIKPVDAETCEAAIEVLKKRVSAKYYCIKLGEKGCYVDGEIIPSIKVKAVDTTAAGDTFTAALALEYFGGADIKVAARFACAAAAVAVSRHGASSSIPTRAEAEALL